MNARLIAALVTVLCTLCVPTQAGQGIEKVEGSQGPTPFISFVGLRLSDPARFKFPHFMIWPKDQGMSLSTTNTTNWMLVEQLGNAIQIHSENLNLK